MKAVRRRKRSPLTQGLLGLAQGMKKLVDGVNVSSGKQSVTRQAQKSGCGGCTTGGK